MYNLLKISILIVFLGLFKGLQAQVLRGGLKDNSGAPLVGAHVFWADKSAQALTDLDGKFELAAAVNGKELVVSHVGFDTLRQTIADVSKVLEWTLSDVKTLATVAISGKKRDNNVSMLGTRMVEHISMNELKKAPCCNLSESFETNGAVDVSYTDAVTGAKEIQMLGLRGIYTQLLVENRPEFYGLAQPYALEYVPGTWIEGIDINKGVGSVRNGMQSIAGQINTELEKPGKGKPLFVNIFGENTGRVEANVHTNHAINKNWYTGLLLHASNISTKRDRDADNFVDMPLKTQFNGLYRLFYTSDKISAQFNIHAIKESRESGQLMPNSGLTNPFLIRANTNRASFFSKWAYMGFDAPYRSLGAQFSATYHDLQSTYGKNNYSGRQKSVYGNVIYQSIIGTTDHKLNSGTSLQIDDYQEFLNDIDLSRRDILVGGFTEYNYSRPTMEGYEDVAVVAALRADYHQKFGLFLTPKFNFKYNFSENQVIRAVAGRGVRVSNPIAENIAFLATNRTVHIDKSLRPEDAWNAGLNYAQTFKINGLEWQFNIDLYHTRFVNQVVADIESTPDKALFYNLEGISRSNAFLVMLNAEVLRGLDVKLVYKFNDVQTTYAGALRQVPLVAKHRGLATVDYKTPNKKWLFNTTLQWVGAQRLADRSQVPHPFVHEFKPFSPSFYLLNASINRFWKRFEWYGGVENITDYVQHKPIIAYQAPDSPYFDATQVYAPMMGRRIYTGIRFWID